MNDSIELSRLTFFVFAIAVSTTDFYSLLKRNFYSRGELENLMELYRVYKKNGNRTLACYRAFNI